MRGVHANVGRGGGQPSKVGDHSVCTIFGAAQKQGSSFVFCHFFKWGPEIMDNFSLYRFQPCKPPMFGRIWGNNLGGHFEHHVWGTQWPSSSTKHGGCAYSQKGLLTSQCILQHQMNGIKYMSYNHI